MLGPKKILDLNKDFKSEIIQGLKKFKTERNIWGKKKFVGAKKIWVKQILGPKIFWVTTFFGKHHLCVTNRFLVCTVIVNLSSTCYSCVMGHSDP